MCRVSTLHTAAHATAWSRSVIRITPPPAFASLPPTKNDDGSYAGAIALGVQVG